MRLSDPRKALVAFQYALSLRPQNPEYYQNVSAAYLSLGDKRQAAIALIAGLIVNPDNSELAGSVDKVYQQIDPKGCAVREVEGKPRLDAACTLVREHLCLAYRSLALLSVDIKQERTADELKTTAVSNLGCPAEPFQKILPDAPVF
jgi:hypothetical protein